MAEAPIVQMRGIRKRYGGVTALHDVALDLTEGTIVSLVGDNGAGKSTLVKILTGAVVPDTGHIYVSGRKVDIRKPKDSQDLGITAIYQDLALFNNLNVGENVFAGRELTRRIAGVSFLRRRKMAQASYELIQRLGIITLSSASQQVGVLSGGQRQMVAVARAIGMNSRVMVLDEPTAALGIRESGFLLDQVRRLRDHGLAILFITHRLPDALHISDRIVVLKGGAVQGDLSPSSCSLEDVADLIIRGGEPPTIDAPTITVVDEI